MTPPGQDVDPDLSPFGLMSMSQMSLLGLPSAYSVGV